MRRERETPTPKLSTSSRSLDKEGMHPQIVKPEEYTGYPNGTVDAAEDPKPEVDDDMRDRVDFLACLLADYMHK